MTLKAGRMRLKKQTNAAVFKEDYVDRGCQIFEQSNLASAVALPEARLLWVQEC